MLIEVKIYGIGMWFQEVAIEEKLTPTKGWIETDSIRRITVQQKELVEWVEKKEITRSPIDVPWLVRVLAYFTRNRIPKYEEITRTVRESRGTGNKIEYWEIVYFDGNEVCIVPNRQITG